MEEKIEKLAKLAGDTNKYQYIMLLITFFVWANISLMGIALPYLEKSRDIQYTDLKTGQIIRTELNYTICDEKISYDTIKIYGSSVTSYFNIECDKTTVGMIGSGTFAGSLIASLIFQYLIPLIGSKKTCTIGLISFSIFSIITYTFSISIVAFIIFCFFIQTFAIIGVYGSFMNCNEVVGSKRRSLFGAIINTGFTICGISYSLLYKYIDNWRIIFCISGISILIICILFVLISEETPTFYLNKGEIDEYVSALYKIAIFNSNGNKHCLFYKKVLDTSDPEEMTNEYKEIIKELKELNFKKAENKVTNKSNTLSLITYKSQRYKFLISCVLWTCVISNYFGLTIYTKDLSGDLYLTIILVFVFELTSYIVTGFLIDTKMFGRKKTLMMCFLIASVAFGLMVTIPMPIIGKSILVFFGMFGVGGNYNILFTYTFELYPSSVRTQGFAINTGIARIGNIIFPLLIEFFQQYILIIFAAMNLMCFGLMFFMPET